MNLRHSPQALAAALLLTAAPAIAAELPQIGGVVNYVASSGTVAVNGAPVVSFSVDKDGSGGSGMDLTDWMANGTNEITLSVEPASERGKATLELQDFGSQDAILTLEQEGKGEISGTVEVKGLPEWAWTTATPQDAAANGLAGEVAALHAAYAGSEIDRILAVSAPFFADQAKVEGLTEEIFREQVPPMLETGTLKDLPDIEIASYLDGKLFRVTGPDGNPPINVEFESEGMSGAMRTGEWWSHIDGAWQVVR